MKSKCFLYVGGGTCLLHPGSGWCLPPLNPMQVHFQEVHVTDQLGDASKALARLPWGRHLIQPPRDQEAVLAGQPLRTSWWYPSSGCSLSSEFGLKIGLAQRVVRAWSLLGEMHAPRATRPDTPVPVVESVCEDPGPGISMLTLCFAPAKRLLIPHHSILMPP